MSHGWSAEPTLDAQYTRRRMAPMDPASNAAYTHSRTRTTSSNTFPAGMHGVYTPNPYQQQQTHLAHPQAYHQRRSPSVNTFSTVSSGGGMPPPAAYRTSPTLDVRRSTSSRSGGTTNSPQSGSYVALLRRQKATVWSDRAQPEDPRLLAQQRAAKMRANREVVGGSGLGIAPAAPGRTSTGLSSTGGKVAAKIRHHGKPTVIGYSPGNLNGVSGVPLRLSATEVEGEESDDDDATVQRQHHRRTGSSGRNSIASGRRAMVYRTSGGLGPTGGATRWSPSATPERTGSLVDDRQAAQAPPTDDSGSAKARSFGSGSSGERLDNVPELSGNSAHLATNSTKHATVTREKSVKGVDDLKRRGSVDERTATMTAGRLYIANPD